MSNSAGKGSNRRPRQTTKEEDDLRWAYFQGAIKFDEYERRYKKLLKEGKIKRNGKVVDGG